jgi:hypothetical protein
MSLVMVNDCWVRVDFLPIWSLNEIVSFEESCNDGNGQLSARAD